MILKLFVLYYFVQFATARHHLSPRIAGGINANENQTPYICSIHSNETYFCGCVIFNERWIVTTAYCLDGRNPENITILVGTNDLISGGTKYNVDHIIVHEKYKYPNNNIAVASVQTPIIFGDKVKAADIFLDPVPEGSHVTFIAWGAPDNKKNILNRLQTINSTTISEQKCKEVYTDKLDDDSEICIQDVAGKGPCKGSFGGSLIYDNKLVGLLIVFWHIQNNQGIWECAKGQPNLFVRVASYHEWIENHTKIDVVNAHSPNIPSDVPNIISIKKVVINLFGNYE